MTKSDSVESLDQIIDNKLVVTGDQSMIVTYSSYLKILGLQNPSEYTQFSLTSTAQTENLFKGTSKVLLTWKESIVFPKLRKLDMCKNINLIDKTFISMPVGFMVNKNINNLLQTLNK